MRLRILLHIASDQLPILAVGCVLGVFLGSAIFYAHMVLLDGHQELAW